VGGGPPPPTAAQVAVTVVSDLEPRRRQGAAKRRQVKAWRCCVDGSTQNGEQESCDHHSVDDRRGEIRLGDTAKELLSQASLAVLATIGEGGAPHATAMWVDIEGERVVMATTKDTQKYRNLVRDPRVCVTVVSRDNPYLELVVHGRVTALRADGRDTIDRMSTKYYGVTPYPLYEAGQEWVTVVIDVDSADSNENVPQFEGAK